MGAMVRIRNDVHKVAKELAKTAGVSISEVVSRALEEYRRKHFLQGLADDFAALKVRGGNWKRELEDRRAWEGTLADDTDND